ncbi:cell wall-binding repeat-containing protein [uncultured Serinicoccus sp.]|uniref:cell wall-binding repeat-containing protein n=1 Tax=uncultured Serinicoccus sp. TaxID=735514 RepID=UPI002636610E|nr:cell wall-binding repeat-containing protein [uncultured Serinicoccus sp.]
MLLRRFSTAVVVAGSALALALGQVPAQADSAGAARPAVSPAVSAAAPVLSQLPPPQPGAEVYRRPVDGSYTISGRGFGHGIGMSQYGAHGAGLAGLSHTQILSYYYPGTRLDTLTFGPIRVGITVDDDGGTRVAHRSGLRVGNAATSTTTYALPSGRAQWRVLATGATASTCVLQGRVDGVWSTTWPSGLSRSCPLTFSSPTDGSVDLFLPDGSRRVYRGVLTAVHTGSSDLTTVNRVPMQSYLRSVVASEMPASFHAAALRSQAVSARTYAARGVGGTAIYDTCDTVACQVYRGRGVRTSGGGITSYEHPNTDAAVGATAGQVLSYPFGTGRALATTMFSSSSGGYTAPGSAAHPYLAAHRDAYDGVANNARHTWTGELPVTTLQTTFGIAWVERVQVLRRDGFGSFGGRIVTARVEGYNSAGTYTYRDVTGPDLRFARPYPTHSNGLSSHYFTFVAEPTVSPATRIAGANRYATSAAVSRAWPTGVSVAYVASGRDFPDALTAAARSGVPDAPLLITDPTSLPRETAQALTRLQPERIIVVGGTAAVSAGVAAQLTPYAGSGVVQRIGGADRYEVAANVAAAYPAGVPRVYLASGQDYPDALAGAALAAHQGAPLLITRPTRLPTAVAEQLERLSPGRLIVLGGSGAVSDATARAAATSGGTGTFTRVSGSDRYATAQAVSRSYPAATTRAYVTSGTAYPDALVAAARGGRQGAPLLLTRPTSVPSATTSALRRLTLSSIYVVGGSAVVSDRVVAELGLTLE